MTDCEIVKALECCFANPTCMGCPLIGKSECVDKMERAALHLINRQKAEIEKWRKSAREWREEAMRLLEEGEQE